MKKKQISLSFKKTSITILNNDKMLNIRGGEDVTQSEGCEILGNTKNTKDNNMLCLSKAVNPTDPCFA